MPNKASVLNSRPQSLCMRNRYPGGACLFQPWGGIWGEVVHLTACDSVQPVEELSCEPVVSVCPSPSPTTAAQPPTYLLATTGFSCFHLPGCQVASLSLPTQLPVLLDYLCVVVCPSVRPSVVSFPAQLS